MSTFYGGLWYIFYESNVNEVDVDFFCTICTIRYHIYDIYTIYINHDNSNGKKVCYHLKYDSVVSDYRALASSPPL